tara:strand:- start:818 stop:1114 length:297 start_codon:yes stop_codon:yes gene_type:complete
MPKYTNVVRFRVKSGKQQEFESVFSKAETQSGQLPHISVKTGHQTYVGSGLWESKEKMADARPHMIWLLDSTQHFLEELSPELGVTDPVSGTVVFENK